MNRIICFPPRASFCSPAESQFLNPHPSTHVQEEFRNPYPPFRGEICHSVWWSGGGGLRWVGVVFEEDPGQTHTTVSLTTQQEVTTPVCPRYMTAARRTGTQRIKAKKVGFWRRKTFVVNAYTIVHSWFGLKIPQCFGKCSVPNVYAV